MISSFKKDFCFSAALWWVDPILFTDIYFAFFRCTASGTTLPIIWSESTRTTSFRYKPFCNANLRYLASRWKVSMFCEHIICFRPVEVHLRSRLACCEKCEEKNESAWGTDHIREYFPAAKTSEVFGAELLEDAWDKQVHEADGEQGDGDPTFPLPGPHGLPSGAQRVAAETWRITGVGEGWIRSHCWSTGT